jgi:hypothetical protein
MCNYQLVGGFYVCIAERHEVSEADYYVIERKSGRENGCTGNWHLKEARKWSEKVLVGRGVIRTVIFGE